MRAKSILGIAIALGLAALAGPAAAATFSSGSTGAQGAFPPTTPPGGTTGIKLDLNTGVVTYTPSNTTTTLPNVPGGGFQDGVLNFTTFTLGSGITLTFVKNAKNTPVTILTTGDATVSGTINLSGAAGGGYQGGTVTSPNGGAGGPGGHNGGAGWTGVPATAGPRGATGLGPGGGGGGSFNGSVAVCGGGGGGFGAAGASATTSSSCTSNLIGAGGPAYGHGSLLPLLGGSGGGGTGGGTFGSTYGAGGGGGGALLLACSGTLTLTGTINANGGAGGSSEGGGGAGGGVRLVATTLAGSGGSLTVAGGAGGTGTYSNGGAGSAGRIRLEAYTFTAAITFSVAPSITVPGSTTLAGNPTLSLTSVAGVAAPANPGGAYGAPDITLPNTTTNPVSVALAASNIPLGTTVNVFVTPQEGTASSATSTGLAGSLASSTAAASVTIPLDQPAVMDATATFTLSAWLGQDSPIKYAGEEVTTATVAARLGGATQVRYFTASGVEVPGEAVAALGLGR
jgi:hypothetical protein